MGLLIIYQVVPILPTVLRTRASIPNDECVYSLPRT